MKPENICSVPVYGNIVIYTVSACETKTYGSYEESAKALATLLWNHVPGGFLRVLLHELEQKRDTSDKELKKWFKAYKKEQARP